MTGALEFQQITDDLFLWQAYEPALKTELFATALICADQLWMVDPIPLADDALSTLTSNRPVGGVIITNGNHLRAAPEFADRLDVPLYATAAAIGENPAGPFREINDGTQICPGLDVIAIDGAAPGEIALHASADGGSLIVGDALINFEPYGFAFLPRKYCSDPKEMRRSLHKLAAVKTKRLLFAHGSPILTNAGDRLRQLLESC